MLIFLNIGCNTDSKPIEASNLIVDDKLVWVYTHSHKDGIDYTVFSPEKPVNKGALPHNFLAIKNREKEKWNCLLKWENDILWFYTPSSHSFASHNSEDGKTKWTIIEEKDFNYFFFEDLDGGFIRFSNECGKKDVLCLDAEEVVIGM